MFADAIDFELHSADFQFCNQVAQLMFRPTDIDQRAEQHVAADPGGAVEICNAHYRAIASSGTRAFTALLIRVNKRCAAVAAPNPLSMFTTVKPVAQLFSMPSNAATPWKLAP